jgi:hypothetical protein
MVTTPKLSRDSHVPFVGAHGRAVAKPRVCPAAGRLVTNNGLASTKVSWRPVVNRRQAEFAGNQKQFSGPAVAGVDAPLTESGDVCVVIPGAFSGYPRVFSSNAEPGIYGKSFGDRPLTGHVFTHADATRVEYFSPR